MAHAESVAPAPAHPEVAFVVNGAPAAVHAHPMSRLLDVLREDLHLFGTKEGCGEGECGACSVFVDGVLVNSCLVPVCQVAGARIETIEGMSAHPRLRVLQEAFVRDGGAQCGICTPGMLMAAAALVQVDTDADEATIRTALAGNLCRCTGYVRIVDAVVHALAELRAADAGGTP
ncbi:MAG: (2Fe-2S)-binding protein [Myxococcales bacterium]|nr:(2Fe-2S)-binding protein [Myxococcales bacterium]